MKPTASFTKANRVYSFRGRRGRTQDTQPFCCVSRPATRARPLRLGECSSGVGQARASAVCRFHEPAAFENLDRSPVDLANAAETRLLQHARSINATTRALHWAALGAPR